jgi:hypothetical protein
VRDHSQALLCWHCMAVVDACPPVCALCALYSHSRVLPTLHREAAEHANGLHQGARRTGVARYGRGIHVPDRGPCALRVLEQDTRAVLSSRSRSSALRVRMHSYHAQPSSCASRSMKPAACCCRRVSTICCAQCACDAQTARTALPPCAHAVLVHVRAGDCVRLDPTDKLLVKNLSPSEDAVFVFALYCEDPPSAEAADTAAAAPTAAADSAVTGAAAAADSDAAAAASDTAVTAGASAQSTSAATVQSEPSAMDLQ